MIDYQIQTITRRCSVSGKELQPGEKFFSILLDEAGSLVRKDFSSEKWQGPPENCFCFWSGKVPAATSPKRIQFDDDLLFDCFHRLEGENDLGKVKFRYVLGLLLMRRKRLKFADAITEHGQEIMKLRCVRSGTEYRLVNPQLNEEEITSVQQEVFKLLGWE